MTTPLTELEATILQAMPDEHYIDAEGVEKKLKGSGYTVQDVVNALLALNQRGLIVTGIDRRTPNPVAYFKRA